MDKTFVVSYINLFDNELTSELIKAESKIEAISKHSKLQSSLNQHWISKLQPDLESIKIEFFDADSNIEVIELVIDDKGEISATP